SAITRRGPRSPAPPSSSSAPSSSASATDGPPGLHPITESRHPREVAGERPHVVILGGGFGGLTAARALAKAPVQITLLDRRNHHLFQPLLYQVATAALNPADIAVPIRAIVRRQKNVHVLMGEAVAIDAASRKVRLA